MGPILLLVHIEFVASQINATAKPRKGVLGKFCCVPAGNARLCVVGPGGLRRPAQVEGGQLDLRCHQLRNRNL
ncbi:MAG: hypothetical protein JWP89_6390 [Schlesneria sp.]|nr:hypothetical protein [Schlesneria sp.]